MTKHIPPNGERQGLFEKFCKSPGNPRPAREQNVPGPFIYGKVKLSRTNRKECGKGGNYSHKRAKQS
jgi:hypothetical protein